MDGKLAAIGDERLPAAFWDRVGVDQFGCWIYGEPADNYAKFRGEFVHILARRELVGPYPDDLDLDHLCTIKRCVNPEHLEPVTKAVNTRRAKRVSHALRTQIRETERAFGLEFLLQQVRVGLDVLDVGVTMVELRSARRYKGIVKVRHAIAWWMKLRGASFPEIGRALNRDHSTIQCAVRSFERHLQRGDKCAIDYKFAFSRHTDLPIGG